MSQTLVAFLAFLAGGLVAITDGSRAISVACLAVGLGLAPAAASVGGQPAAVVPAASGLAGAVLAVAAERLARRVGRTRGHDPTVPVVAPREALFGPRSIRVLGAALALLAASWVSLNVNVGGAATAQGAVFAAAYLWLVGAVRLLRARAVEDLAVGAAAVALAGATGWLLEEGPVSTPEAWVCAGLAPAAALVAGWLTGRHHRPAPPQVEGAG